MGFSATETIESELKFEREADSVGIRVKKHRSDNGVHTSKEFLENLAKENQKITHSGVGGHHHNALAENGIKIIVNKARTLMFHAALCWPSQVDMRLWPLAMQHSVHLHNHTPSRGSRLSPIEVWSSTRSNHSELKNAQPWRCPVVVLCPKLQD